MLSAGYPADRGLARRGSYTIKKIGKQEYLYKIITEKDKQKWKLIGNVKDLDAKDPILAKARAVILSKEAKGLVSDRLNES